MDKASIKPTQKHKVIDLVRSAGIDVSDWSNGKRGAAGASVNPKYCYEWAYIEPGKVVVLNLWHDVFEDEDGRVVQRNNFRADAQHYSSLGGHTNWARRALKIDEAIRTALADRLPIRVIINDGARRPSRDPDAGPSKVRLRQLDTEAWSVLSYDKLTGAHVLLRGPTAPIYIDQFSLLDIGTDEPGRSSTIGTRIDRDARVRLAALQRSRGKCEYCGVNGFRRADGATYLETHHIVPLSEQGADRLSNVIALCPNHHREAHHGADAVILRAEFQKIVAAF